MKKIILYLLILSLFSCQKIDRQGAISVGECYKVSIAVDCLSTVQKSSFIANEELIENLHVWVYDSSTGALLGSFLFSETSILKGELDISIPKRELYTFLFLANMTRVEAPSNLSDALSMRYQLDRDLTLRRIFPMSQSMERRPVFDGMTLNVSLRRMVAKYVFRLDKSNLKGTFILKSVNVRQSAMDACIFNSSSALSVADGDSASQQDLDMVSEGRTANLYMLENCRGMLTPWNTDPWKKIPTDPAESRLATFLEVHATYISPTLQSDDLTYRMYLGENDTKNYDITRNTIHVVTLIPSDNGIVEGILQTQWKIDPGDYEITGKLSFSKNIATCAAAYEPPYILRSNGIRVQTISDSISVRRSSTKLSYSITYDSQSSNINVNTSGDKAVFSPITGMMPKGTFDINIKSYDNLLSDKATIYGGIMDLRLRFNHSTGVIQMWSGDDNPRGIRFHVKMNYEIQSSAWGGSSWSRLQEYKDSSQGKIEFDLTPNMKPQNVDGGQLCSAIRNQSDGMVPAPDGFAQYTPNQLNLDFDISVVSPKEWQGRTVVRYNAGMFEQTSVGYVSNQYYMGFWYLSNRYDGNVDFHRKAGSGESTSILNVRESCNGQSFRLAPQDYRSAVFEI